MIYSKINGSGSYLPKKILTNKDLELSLDTTDDWIRSRTGILQRHIAGKDERTSDLESFRVEKPELEGLKVLGKIELPEPKPKAEVKENTPKEAKGDRTINERGAKRRYQKDSRRKNSKDRRTPAEQRKREEYLAEKRKKAEEQKLKELKKKHYEENVKAKIEAKPKKKKKKFVQQQATQSSSKITQSQKSASKNPVVRFWKWLNGDFDNFN